MKQEKNIILFLGTAYNSNIDDVENFELSQKRNFRTAVLTSREMNLNEKPPKQEGVEKRFDFVLRCDTKNISDIEKTVSPIKNDIAIVFCYFESWMPLYRRLVKLLPDVNMPSEESLEICNSKLEMRKKFMERYPEITPKFMFIKDMNNIEDISQNIGFPCVTKPLNLTKSRLVIRSGNREELERNLQNTFKKISEVYKSVHSENEPMILAEEYMEGELYSIDAYVSPKGKIHLTPIVRVVTGKDIGINDFFNYYRVTPAKITKSEEKKAQEISMKALKATGPTSVTVHIELMRTQKNDWKIVELQTRPGGYRNEMLKLSFGIKHYENDFLNRLGRRPLIYRKPISYTAVLEIFPEREGRIISVEGTGEMKKLPSFLRYEQAKSPGDMCGYSRDGYTYVLQVVLNNKNEKVLYSDLEKMKSLIKILVA